MFSKKLIYVALLSAATTCASGAAMAYGEGAGLVTGGVVGALIGNSVNGRNGAIVGGVLGAAVGASAAGNYNNGYYAQPAPAYYPPQTSQTYYAPPAVYSAPAPVYYEAPQVTSQVTYYPSAPVYYAPPVYVERVYGGYGYYGDRRGHDRHGWR
ncbi:MAG: glycine zipper 2TM domain-containing protein [Janthinobacterium lividum]